MTDPAMPPDLDRLLSAATIPAMPAELIERIVAEAQRSDRTAPPVQTRRRAHARAWTRRGVRTGIVAVSLMLATAVAAAFGGGAVSVARIQAVAQHVVERIRHPFHHTASVAGPMHPVSDRMNVPPGAIRVAPARFAPGFASHAYGSRAISPQRSGRAFIGEPPTRATPLGHGAIDRPSAHHQARAAVMHPVVHRPFNRPPGIERSKRQDRGLDHPSVAKPIEPRRDRFSTPPVSTVSQRAPDMSLRDDGRRRFDGPQWRDPSRFGNTPGPRWPGWRRRMTGGEGAVVLGWRRGRPAGGMRPFRLGAGRRSRQF